MRILLAGLGRWGEKHLRVLRELGADVWVAEIAAERRAAALRMGLAPERVVDDVRTALGEVDAVDVVTSAEAHLAVAQACLQSGRHCFVEKPLALTAAEGRQLVALANEAQRVLQVGHIFRFHPVTAALGDVLAAGRIGAVRFASARFAGFKRPRTDVGVTQTDAIHYFDLFAYLLKQAPARVTAAQGNFLGRGLDDMSVTVVHYGDVPVLVQADYFTPGTWRECVVVGEQGSLVADYAASTVTLHQTFHRESRQGWEAVDAGKEPLPTADVEPLRVELAAFLDACAGRRTPAVSGAEGVSALEVAEAAALAARLGRTVTLAEVRA